MFAIFIADDHPLLRSAVARTVSHLVPTAQILEASCLQSLLRLFDGAVRADLVLLDLDMPGVNGLSGLETLRSRYPDTPVAILSATEAPDIVQAARELGAIAFFPKSASPKVFSAALAALVRRISAADPAAADTADEPTAAQILARLTPQQLRVLHLVGAGLLNKQIAHELRLSEATVKAHMSAILSKLGVANRTHAALIARQIPAAD
jgi:DNA-binding NarL/FixJ family response regulator